MNGASSNWNPKPADRVVRHPRSGELGPVRIGLPPPRTHSIALNPSLILAYAFAVLIGLGTVFLTLPFASTGDGFAPFIDALFTATSAVTVTGLVTQETSSYWTGFGQFIILVLMFIGGLGVMTIVGSVFILAGQQLPLAQRMVMRETIGTASFTNIARITVRIVLWAVAIQAIGFVVLWIRFAIIDTPEAAWHALFQAISGFNNAGFTSLPDSDNLSAFGTDTFVVGSIAVLVVLGSLSYWVLDDVVRKRRFSRFALNTKLVLVFTALLIFAGAAAFILFESGNEGTMGDLPIHNKLTTSVFHSVNRTSGFSTVDFDETTDQTNFSYMALMFVGGASASVAGGIKVNTFALIVIATLASLRGNSTVSTFGRRVPNVQVRWAQVLVLGSIFCVFLLGFTLAFIEPEYAFLDLLFESVSAFGTVGLTTGLTGDLSSVSKLLLALAMFVGRVVPPMVIVVALSKFDEVDQIRYPKERVSIG